MNIAIFCLYAAIALAAIIFMGLREFHMLQLNGYKTPEHSWWMKKNYKRYILPIILFVGHFALLFTDPVIWEPEKHVFNDHLNTLSIYICSCMTVLNIKIAVDNRPGKKFKKPFVYTARVKRMLTTFFILIALIFTAAFFSANRVRIEGDTRFTNNLPFILIGSALYLTPILVPLSNIINKPIEKAVQNHYINDAKRMLDDMPSLHKVGITGSYGKTSMKFYLSELLGSQYETLKTPESFNTPMGVTITIRRDLRPTHEYFICEMGARRVREINELCEIAHPHDGIITSVGPQHLETFKSVENVLNTKFELADSVQASGGKIYLNGDNELIRSKAPQYKNAVLYGLHESCHYRGSDVSVSDKGTEFTVTAPDGSSCRYTTKLLGEHSVQNLLGAIAYCHGTGIALEKLVIPVRKIAAVPHRLQLLDKGGGLTFIDDAYNSNPSGCRAALNVLGLFDACRILVTPGMVELGEKQHELNREFGSEAAKVCDYIALVGKKQTEPIFEGIQNADFDMSRVFVCDTLGEALDKVRSIVTDKKKIVLLENDLPDNY
ncbi:MAG: UDP-N-acetylmuramoyl-tripeptide--D-alanyl-D-alanine ligase [Ruminococcus sp.]|nr:UDP-N-acetylmuramoyl-tripeptide--D-alanyl-D-alanine ligase [Ruminococcus sp.]